MTPEVVSIVAGIVGGIVAVTVTGLTLLIREIFHTLAGRRALKRKKEQDRLELERKQKEDAQTLALQAAEDALKVKAEEEKQRLAKQAAEDAEDRRTDALFRKFGQRYVDEAVARADATDQKFTALQESTRLKLAAFDTLQVTFNEMQKVYNEQGPRITALEGQNKTQADEMSRQAGQIGDLQKELHMALNDNRAKDALIATKDQLLSEKDARIAQLERELATEQTDKSTLRAERDRLIEERNELRAELDTLRKVGTGPLADRPSTGTDAVRVVEAPVSVVVPSGSEPSLSVTSGPPSPSLSPREQPGGTGTDVVSTDSTKETN